MLLRLVTPACLVRLTSARMVPSRRRLSTEAAADASADSEGATHKISMPHPEGQAKQYPQKIVKIVEDISQLNLLEVADLNELLKSRLNISDAPVMAFGGPVAGGVAGAAPGEEAEEDAAPVAVQTSFTLTLKGFDAAKKVALIKELKSQIEGMNLVQAKKFVEATPAVVKADIAKDEAEKLKKVLEEAGAECTIE